MILLSYACFKDPSQVKTTSRQQKEIPAPSGDYWTYTPRPQIPPLAVEIELSDDESIRGQCVTCGQQPAGLV